MKKLLLLAPLLLISVSSFAETTSASCLKPLYSTPTNNCYETQSGCLAFAREQAETAAKDRCVRATGAREIYHVDQNYESVSVRSASEYWCTVGIRYSCKN